MTPRINHRTVTPKKCSWFLLTVSSFWWFPIASFVVRNGRCLRPCSVSGRYGLAWNRWFALQRHLEAALTALGMVVHIDEKDGTCFFIQVYLKIRICTTGPHSGLVGNWGMYLEISWFTIMFPYDRWLKCLFRGILHFQTARPSRLGGNPWIHLQQLGDRNKIWRTP